MAIVLDYDYKLDRILRSRIISYVIEQFLKLDVIFCRFWAHLNYSFLSGLKKNLQP